MRLASRSARRNARSLSAFRFSASTGCLLWGGGRCVVLLGSRGNAMRVGRVRRTWLCSDKSSLLGADEALPAGRYLRRRKIGSCPSDNLLYRISCRCFADVSASEGMCVRGEHKQHSGAGCHQRNARHIHPPSSSKDDSALPLLSKRAIRGAVHEFGPL